jgi:hypothetical protein
MGGGNIAYVRAVTLARLRLKGILVERPFYSPRAICEADTSDQTVSSTHDP